MEYVSYTNNEMNDVRVSIYEQVYGPNWRERRDRVLSLEREMIRAAEIENYEDAARFRDIINTLQVRQCKFV